MEQRNYLGIYLRKEAATVVCLDSQARGRNVLDCFTVWLQEQQPANTTAALSNLTSLIVERCTDRIPSYPDCEVAVALDCAMFMQHNIRSEFADIKKIAQTVKFDTEEALAMDISDVAIAFKITSSDENGSALSVFTAQRKILSDIILSLQSNNIDPVNIEPDVNCLSRFIWQNVSVPDDSHPFFCALSGHNGYFVAPVLPGMRGGSVLRTFFLGPGQTRAELLTREIPVTAALVEGHQPVDSLKVFDSTGSVNHKELGERLGIDASELDLVASAAVAPDRLADCDDPVDFAVAYGAALAYQEKDAHINFRTDFMPYEGKKARLEKTMKFLSVSVAILVLAVGLYFQLRLFQKNKYRSRIRQKLETQYAAVMFGKKPPPKLDPVSKLRGELRRIRDLKSGQFSVTGQLPVTTKLTMVLEAFNSCAAQTNLKIGKITIVAQSIRIEGNTSSRKNTLKLFEEIKKNKLKINSDSHGSKGNRATFSVTVVPQQ